MSNVIEMAGLHKARLMTRRPLRLLALVTAALMVAGACSSDDPVVETSADNSDVVLRPVILDYSPTLSDISALLYLATNADVDLLAVTLAGTGESDCEPGIRHTRSLLQVAGRPDVPVACGTETPMAGSRDWPEEWRAAANSVVGVLLPGVAQQDPVDAMDLLVSTLEQADEPVSIVTLAPLTNIGLLLRSQPQLAERVASVVVMGGAFDVAGNVDTAPAAEWNLHIDPESVRAVVDSGVAITFVGLDATDSVPGNLRLAALLDHTASTPSGAAVHQLWAAKLDLITAPGRYFWDELAAVAALDADIISTERRTIRIADNGATVQDDDGVAVAVAIRADRNRFEGEFLRVFASGQPVEIVAPSADEAAYVAELESALTQFGTDIEAVFVPLFDGDESINTNEQVDTFTAGFSEAASAHSMSVAEIEAPAFFAETHNRLVEASAAIVTVMADFRSASAERAKDVTSLDAFFEEVLESAAIETGLQTLIDQYTKDCTAIAELVLVRGGDLEDCFGTEG
jgi:inosine-uridine nucleoside N-ribohydrolase